MNWQEFKRRCGNFKRMAPKDVLFVAICFAVAIVMCVLLAMGLI